MRRWRELRGTGWQRARPLPSPAAAVAPLVARPLLRDLGLGALVAFLCGLLPALATLIVVPAPLHPVPAVARLRLAQLAEARLALYRDAPSPFGTLTLWMDCRGR